LLWCWVFGICLSSYSRDSWVAYAISSSRCCGGFDVCCGCTSSFEVGPWFSAFVYSSANHACFGLGLCLLLMRGLYIVYLFRGCWPLVSALFVLGCGLGTVVFMPLVDTLLGIRVFGRRIVCRCFLGTSLPCLSARCMFLSSPPGWVEAGRLRYLHLVLSRYSLGLCPFWAAR